MSNYHAVLIGACLLVASGVIGLSLGLITPSPNLAVLPGMAAMILGCVFAYHALRGMSSKDKPA